jgi:hypothetical protein
LSWLKIKIKSSNNRSVGLKSRLPVITGAGGNKLPLINQGWLQNAAIPKKYTLWRRFLEKTD